MSMTCGQSRSAVDRRLPGRRELGGRGSAGPRGGRCPASPAPPRRPPGGRNRCSRGRARSALSGPCIMASWIARLANTAPIGKAPLVRPLAVVIRSGVTPKYCAANGAPSRPKPVITSSKISRMPCLVAERAQPLQIAHRRRQHAGRARHRLDDHRGDGLGAVQGDQPLQVVGQLRAVLRLAAGEGVPRQVVGVAQVVGARQGQEGAAVVDQAAHRDAAEADPVIALLAADQPGALALAAGAVVGERDLQRRVHRLRAGVGEEDPVEARPARAWRQLAWRNRRPAGGPSGTTGA